MSGGDKAKAAVLRAQRALEEQFAKMKRAPPESGPVEQVYEAAPKPSASSSADPPATDNQHKAQQPDVKPKTPKLPPEQVANQLFKK